MTQMDATAQTPTSLGSGITISGLTKKFSIGRETVTALDNATLHSDKVRSCRYSGLQVAVNQQSSESWLV